MLISDDPITVYTLQGSQVNNYAIQIVLQVFVFLTCNVYLVRWQSLVGPRFSKDSTLCAFR